MRENTAQAHDYVGGIGGYYVLCGTVPYGPFGLRSTLEAWMDATPCTRVHKVKVLNRPIGPDERYLDDYELGFR
jgi:hypothetical protein